MFLFHFQHGALLLVHFCDKLLPFCQLPDSSVGLFFLFQQFDYAALDGGLLIFAHPVVLSRPIHVCDLAGRRVADIHPLVLEARRESLVRAIRFFLFDVWRGCQLDKLLLHL